VAQKRGKSGAPESAERKVVGVRLDDEILDRLERGGGSLSDEIRERLKRTFTEDDLATATRELRDALVHLAAKLRADYGNREWWESAYAHEAFVAAVMQRLAEYAPTPPSQKGGAVSDLFDPPDMIGRLRERDDRREHSYPQLEAAQKRRSSAHRLRGKKDDNK
jgi:hypothetical protein